MTLLRHNYPRLLNDFLQRELNAFFSGGTMGANVPLANIINNPDNFTVEIAAPGLKKNDFKVELNNHVLTVSGKTSGYLSKEFDFNTFRRSFTLPEAVVEEENIQARYEAGILRLVIPKKEEARQKPAKMIAIS